MIRYRVPAVCALLVVACAGSQFGDVDDFAEIGGERPDMVIAENAGDIIERYTVEFKIPNPLFGPAGFAPGRTDPSHQSSIMCRATLLDAFSTEADMLLHCPDSLGVDEAAECREAYGNDHLREGTFRVRISMETGFSERSMNRDYWSIYLENVNGVMIEPNDYTASPVTAFDDSVYSSLTQKSLPRHVMYRDLTLYFNRVAFWGEDLFGPENPYLVLVMSREQRTVARVVWDLAGHESR